MVGGVLAAGLRDPDIYVLPEGWTEVARRVPTSTITLPDGSTQEVGEHTITEYCDADDVCQVNRPANAAGDAIAGLPDGWTTGVGTQEEEGFDTQDEFMRAYNEAVARGATPEYEHIDEEYGEYWIIYEYLYTAYCDTDGNCQAEAPPFDRSRGQLTLTTGSLQMFDLIDSQSSRQWSLSASIGKPNATKTEWTVNGLGGSYSSSNRDGITRATVTSGEITITSLGETEQDSLLANINRDASNVQIITRDESFRTGTINVDLEGIRNFKRNFQSSKNLARALTVNTDFLVNDGSGLTLEEQGEDAVELFRRLIGNGASEEEVRELTATPDFQDVARTIGRYKEFAKAGLKMDEIDKALVTLDIPLLLGSSSSYEGGSIEVPCETSGFSRTICEMSLERFKELLGPENQKQLLRDSIESIMNRPIMSRFSGTWKADVVGKGLSDLSEHHFGELVSTLYACSNIYPEVYLELATPGEEFYESFVQIGRLYGFSEEAIQNIASASQVALALSEDGQITESGREIVEQSWLDEMGWWNARMTGIYFAAISTTGDYVDAAVGTIEFAQILANEESRNKLAVELIVTASYYEQNPDEFRALLKKLGIETWDVAWDTVGDAVDITEPGGMTDAQIKVLTTIFAGGAFIKGGGKIAQLISEARKQAKKGNGDDAFGAPDLNNLEEGDVGTFGQLAPNSIGDGMTPDHIPSFAAIKKAIADAAIDLDDEALKALRNNTNCVMVKTCDHLSFSRTFGGRNSRNNSELINYDAQDLYRAANLDMDAWEVLWRSQGWPQAKIDFVRRNVHRVNSTLFKQLGIPYGSS